jgi:hypothetical protein
MMKIKYPIFGILLAIFTLSFAPQIAHGATTDRYVLVAGFLNETMVGYFRDNISALKKNGIEDDHILVPKVPSKTYVETNSESLATQIKQFPGTEPIVVIAHSKGAVETLIWAFENSEFVRDHVRAIFLVQGAFGGCKIADFLEGKGHPIDNNMPMKYRYSLEVMRLEGWHENRVAHDGLVSLTTEESAKLWPDLIKKYPQALANISKKILYILGTESVSNLPLLLRPMGSYLTTYYNKNNDGIILTEDQFVPGIGSVFLSAEADHMGWFMPRPESSVSSIDRENFTNIIYTFASGLEL